MKASELENMTKNVQILRKKEEDRRQKREFERDRAEEERELTWLEFSGRLENAVGILR